MKARVEALKLSLEALATVGKAPRERPFSHPLLPGDKRFDCAGLTLSPEARALLAAK